LVEGVALPTKPKLNEKIVDINALINRSWTEAELSAKLERSGAITQKYRSLEISRLTSQYKAARHDGDEGLMEKIQAELKALDGPKLAYGTSIAPKPQGPRKMTQQDQLAVLNFENRRKNAEEIRAAQIAERRAIRKIEAAIARGEQVEEDHSRRVKTRAKTSFDVNHVDTPKRSGANTPAASTPKVEPIKEELLPHVLKIQELQKNASLVSGGMKRKPVCDDDLIGAIDLGLEIEL
jgi:RNA polymerase-associated protein RTF1